MGGFAGSHHNAIAQLEANGHAKLICTCDPRPENFAQEQETWRLAQRGVGVFSDYRAMLETYHRGLDLVVIPTPINLHAEMHAAATALGLPVYLEKPPTLDHTELEQMIVADARAAAGQERQRAVRDIEVAADHAMKNLAETTANLAVELAGKAIRETLVPAKRAELVREALQKLGGDASPSPPTSLTHIPRARRTARLAQ